MDSLSDYPRDCSVHELFEAVAARFPLHPAVRTEAETVSYAELNRRANTLANYLHAQGVVQGDRVGLFLDRGIHLVVGQLAILKTGAVYVPIEMKAPAERVAFFVSDAAMRIVLRSTDSVDLALPATVRMLDLDREAESIAASSSDPLPIRVGGEDAAYVMYTSGSTGTPKGVEIPHRGIVRLVRQQEYFPAGPTECTLLLASPGFDGTTYELYSALLNGGCCAVFPDRFIDFARLRHVIATLGVTSTWFSTGLFNQVIDNSPLVLETLRHVLVGGEALSAPHMLRAKALLPHVEFGNGYGPTECTTLAVSWVIGAPEAWGCESVPLGFPLNHTECHIVNAEMQLAALGEVGELLLGGDGLALGYLNRPDLTAEKFIANPFASDPGARLYRTGDRCYWLPNGMIAYVGRNDDQVKLNGYRVELGEVESALRDCPDVVNAAVVVHEYNSGVRGLIGCVVTQPNSEWSEEALLTALARELPNQMLPGRIFRVDDLPLTLNGKVDRKQLASSVVTIFSTETESPRRAVSDGSTLTALEKDLLVVWRAVLKDPRVNVDDDFFRLGGDSLLAAELESEIERRTGRSIPGGTTHRFSTPRLLARHLTGNTAIEESPIPEAKALVGGGGGTPVFFMPDMSGYGLMPKALSQALLGKRPYFDRLTFRPRGLFGGSPLSIEDAAEEVLAQVRRIRPRGPYVFVGYSFGGYLAFEVARLLAERGDEVERVVLWDAVPESPVSQRSLLDVFGFILRKALSPSTWRNPRWVLDRLKYATQFLQELPRALRPDPAQTVPALSDFASERAVLRFRPKPYRGQVSLLCCTGSGESIRSRPVPAYSGWADAVPKENMAIFEIACHHSDVLEEPNVALFAEQTRRILEDSGQAQRGLRRVG